MMHDEIISESRGSTCAACDSSGAVSADVVKHSMTAGRWLLQVWARLRAPNWAADVMAKDGFMEDQNGAAAHHPICLAT